MVFLPNLGVNRRDRLGGIPEYASAQSLDFFDLGQKSAVVLLAPLSAVGAVPRWQRQRVLRLALL
jgi:hypothetical protein